MTASPDPAALAVEDQRLLDKALMASTEKLYDIEPAPAPMPGEERALNLAARAMQRRFGASGTEEDIEAALSDFFAPILAEKEREIGAFKRAHAHELEVAQSHLLAAEAALAETGGAKATYFGGKLIICHPDIPPHLWDGETMQKIEPAAAIRAQGE
jgi:hypothetical protein